MIRRPPRSTRPDTLLPYTTLFRSARLTAAEASDAAVFFWLPCALSPFRPARPSARLSPILLFATVGRPQRGSRHRLPRGKGMDPFAISKEDDATQLSIVASMDLRAADPLLHSFHEIMAQGGKVVKIGR